MNIKMKFLSLISLMAIFVAVAFVGCQKESNIISSNSVDKIKVYQSQNGDVGKIDSTDPIKLDIDWSKESVKKTSANIDISSDGLKRIKSNKNAVYESNLIQTPFSNPSPFLGLSMNWESIDAKFYEFEIRTSVDGSSFNDWQHVHVDGHGTPTDDRQASSLMFLDKTVKFIQWKVTVNSNSTESELKNVQFVFINPGETSPENKKRIEEIRGNINSSRGSYCVKPNTVTRTEWGSDCPQNLMCDNTAATITNVTHLFVHHSNGPTTSTDWAATVKAIQIDHINKTPPWSDIGYNFLIDPDGVMYEGRAGGDSAKGAHLCGNNDNTMAVCMLGNYVNDEITLEARGTLRAILAWKCKKDGIVPLGTGYHSASGLTLDFISGHRDACATECPGDALYAQLLPDVKNYVDYKVDQCSVAACRVAPESMFGNTVMKNLGEFAYLEMNNFVKKITKMYISNQSEINRVFRHYEKNYGYRSKSPR